jgi:2-methylcitrate dehydratase PrpD
MSAPSSPTLAARLAEFAASLHPESIPTAAFERAKLHVLDALGTALAASTCDFADVSAAALHSLGETGEYPVIGRSERLPLRDAMLQNGVLVHGLDFDDTHGASVVHCSASAVPLMLGVGQRCGVSGRAALTAYLLAVEIDARLGAVARGTLQKRGWHPTGIIGAFGCAAAAGHLLGASSRGIADALGITLSMASGNLEFLNDGAWTKRLHPGWAAVAGYTAAAYGQAGFVGPAQAFEGRFGLYRMLLDDPAPDLSGVLEGLGSQWAIFDNGFKPYPACHFLHAFIDCARHCRALPGFDLAAIDHIEALIHPDQIAIVCEPVDAKLAPQSPYDAQFSLQFCVAATLRLGDFGLDELEPAALSDVATLALAQKVRWQPDPASRYPASYSGALRVYLKNGHVLEAREAINRGAAENPLGPEDVMRKFRRNADRCRALSSSDALIAAVMGLDTAPNLAALTHAMVAR